MSLDLALVHDRGAVRADLRWGGRDLVLDATPASPGLVSLLCDRRARPDDPLPLPEPARLAPEILAARRGWCGDALDRAGRRVGSRLWLLQRAKRTEATRRRAEIYAREALAWAEPLGLSVTASWQDGDRLALLCRIGAAEVVVSAELG